VSHKRVAILSSHALFREGLRHLLTGVATVTLASSPEEVADLLVKGQLDVIVVDQEDDDASCSDVVAEWLTTPDVRIITVRLDSAGMQIYDHRHIGLASPADLIAAVTEA
jgi:DNA-binding NarL/FixJ family response regulator